MVFKVKTNSDYIGTQKVYDIEVGDDIYIWTYGRIDQEYRVYELAYGRRILSEEFILEIHKVIYGD